MRALTIKKASCLGCGQMSGLERPLCACRVIILESRQNDDWRSKGRSVNIFFSIVRMNRGRRPNKKEMERYSQFDNDRRQKNWLGIPFIGRCSRSAVMISSRMLSDVILADATLGFPRISFISERWQSMTWMAPARYV